MPFYSSPGAHTKGLISNHLARTASCFDVLFKSELGLNNTALADHQFYRVEAEAESGSKEDCDRDCDNVSSPAPATESGEAGSQTIPSHVSSLLSSIAGTVTALDGYLSFTPLKDKSGNTTSSVQLTDSVPSGQKLVALARIPSDNSTGASVVGTKGERNDGAEVNYMAADAIGNVYLFRNALSTLRATEEVDNKRRRTEASGPSTKLHHGTLVLAASASEPMRGAFPTYGLGAGGWVGLELISSCSGSIVVAVGREHFRDVRIVRITIGHTISGSLLASFYPHHAPTSLASLSADANAKAEWTSLLAVANGPLVSFYDTSFIKPKVGTEMTIAATRTPFFILTTRSTVWSVCSASTSLAATTAVPKHLVWVSSSDRSVSVVDTLRGFMKIHTAPNLLKYDAVTAALACYVENKREVPLQVVVSGIDCEVRSLPSSDLFSNSGGSTKKQQPHSDKPTEVVPEAIIAGPDLSTHNPSSFRGRLNSAIHGEDVWAGAWQSITVEDISTTVAFGLTRSGSLYIAV